MTGYNTEYSDRFWTEKRDMKGGFKESPLQVNKGLGQIETWGEKQIKERSIQLAKKALTVWPDPSLPSEVLEKYRPQQKQTEESEYSINDHKALVEGSAQRVLFETFRKELLDLDPIIRERFCKRYIAYSVDTRFAIIKPYFKDLRLLLKLDFHDELHDPKKMAISDKRKRFNVIKVRLKSLEEIPYVMGLVRQALEKQIGSEREVA